MTIKRTVFHIAKTLTAIMMLLSVMLSNTAYAEKKATEAPKPTPTPRVLDIQKDGPIKANPLLDSAFEMLEKGNLFVERYNQLANRHVVVRFELGVPYFFGGKLCRLLQKPYAAWQNSRYFVEGEKYIYGFDCHGFTKWVYEENGYEHPETIHKAISDYWSRNQHIWVMDVPYEEWHKILPIGALLAIEGNGGNHMMMYVGTLSNYGFTAEEVGKSLAPYLNYPLFIHSGNSLAAVERNQKYIDGLARPWRINNTDGGVNVCIVGIPNDVPPLSGKAGKQEIKYFDLMGQELLAYDLTLKPAYYGWYPTSEPRQLKTPKENNTETIPVPTVHPAIEAPTAKPTKAPKK